MSETETQTAPSFERAKLIAAAVLLVGGFVVFFVLVNQAVWLRSVALVAGLLLAFGVYCWSLQGRGFLLFTRDAYRELGKVVWPARKEALQMTGIVFALVLLLAISLGTVDWMLSKLVALFFGWK